MMRPIVPTILLFAALFGPVPSTEAQTFDLAVSSAGTGGGTVTSSPAGVDCGATCTGTFNGSTLVTLTAAPNATSVFTGWSGACSAQSTCVMTMDAAKSVTATFGSLTYEKLYSFTGTPDGAAPVAPLIQAADGFFYGTTQSGGANSCGTVFRTDGTSAPAILHSFTQEEGCFLTAALLQASDGLFYGVARGGGTFGDGTLFRMDSNGEVTVIHVFQSLVADNGAFPYSALIQASDGFFYGTTTGGGAHYEGAVFRTDASGASFTVLHSFDSADSGGYQPYAPLLQASDGTFYGTTSLGGNPNGPCEECDRIPGGTVFQMDASGNVTYLFNFDLGGGNGDTPFAGLVQTSPTTFYGTTSNLGGLETGLSAWAGTVFLLDRSADWFGLYTLHQFSASSGFPDGAVPAGALIKASDGYIYGTALLGGGLGSPYGQGVVFRLDAASQLAVLHAFDGDAADGDSGSQPGAALIQGIDGNLYGTAASNSLFIGSSGPPGTLFRLNLDLNGPVKTNQTITFAGLADKTISDADFAVSATASSSLAVTFAPSGACTMSGAVVHLTGAGSCTVTASQAGNASYNPAPSVPRSFTVAKLTATLALSNLIQPFDGSPKVVTVTTSPAGLTVVSITYNGSTIAPTASGSYAVVASLTNDTYQATNATGTLVISNPAATLTLSPSSVAGGTTSTATVTLASPAPNGGAVVSLASSAPGAATVPATVLIMKGKTTKTFTVTTFAVATVTPVNISASYAGTTATSPLTVNPAALSALTLNPLGVRGGASSTAKVTLNGPAPAGGLLVTLTSSKPSVAASTSVTVPAGSSSATVPITTFAVTANTTVNITATGGGVSKSSTLTVKK
jgi:uncharacterized repeat protein (TIGR03803 family)